MFSSGLLRNPAPASGQSAPFNPRPGAGPSSGKGTGAPNFQEFLNPNLHNAARSSMGNGVVSYPFLVRPFRSGAGVPAEGEPVFTIRQSAKKAGAGFLITALPLTYLNAKLYDAASQRSAEVSPPVGNSLVTALDKINNADGEGTLSFLGIMRNEAIAPSRHQKLINVDIRGRTRIRNYWDNEIRSGTKLYLIVRRTTGKAEYGTYKPKGREPRDGTRVAKVVPVTRDELGRIMGLQAGAKDALTADDQIIYIGYTMNTTHRKSSMDAAKRATVNTDNVQAIDFIEVALGIGK